MITDRDIQVQVQQVLGEDAPDFDVEGVVGTIKDRHGLIDIDEVPTSEFWKIVEEHVR
jgi:hypothetical protein